MPLKPKLEKEQENKESQMPKTNRGSDLRHKMEESAEYGAQYRAQHQGADLTKTEVKHDEKFVNPDDRKEAQHSDLTQGDKI